MSLKKIIQLSLIVFLAVLVSGCPKVIRNKKNPAENTPVFVFEEDRGEKLNFGIYKKNFIYWRASHDELFDRIDSEKSKREASFDYIIDHIRRMQVTFPDDKENMFEPFIARYKKFEDDAKKENLPNSKQAFIRKSLLKIRKDFVKQFSPNQKQVKEIFNE